MLAGGTYAISPFRGTVAQLSAAWAALRDGWLPGRDLRLDGRAFLEIYPAVIDYELAPPVTRL